jgi:hypothetical protein
VRESSDLKVICLYLLEGKKKKKAMVLDRQWSFNESEG